MQRKIVPTLWFDTGAGPRPAATVLTFEFEADGQCFVATNGGLRRAADGVAA